MVTVLEASLRRLRTDYVDLYYMHAWNAMTPVDEVLSDVQDLVAQGKVRYVAQRRAGMVRGPGPDARRVARGLPLCAVQLEYSLVKLGIELELPGMCEELGMGIVTRPAPGASTMLTYVQ
jgi:aryl-alcohol dehydrogenase-like predicted oxidoreductase